MGISKNHLSYIDFINNEVKTLGFIGGNASIRSSFTNLSERSNTFHDIYKGKKKVIKKTDFIFHCEFEIEIEKKACKILIEAKVKQGFEFSSYAIIILDTEDKNCTPKLMRKFHFDFAPYSKLEKKQSIYHLQYGGASTPNMTKLEIEDELILPWLSVPRITAKPINLALLLDMIFCEFKTEATNKISETSEWRNLIKKNEDLMIKCYYERINSFFSTSHKSNFLYRDFYYGKK